MSVLLVDVVRIYRAIVASTDTLRPEDREALLALLDLESGEPLAQAIREYYRDGDRSDRTPRAMLYMHLGLLCAQLGAK